MQVARLSTGSQVLSSAASYPSHLTRYSVLPPTVRSFSTFSTTYSSSCSSSDSDMSHDEKAGGLFKRARLPRGSLSAVDCKAASRDGEGGAADGAAHAGRAQTVLVVLWWRALLGAWEQRRSLDGYREVFASIRSVLGIATIDEAGE